jgi:hypothetical protein
LPLSTSSGAGEALDRYLKSCVRKQSTCDDEDSDSYEDRRSRKRRKNQSERKGIESVQKGMYHCRMKNETSKSVFHKFHMV